MKKLLIAGAFALLGTAQVAWSANDKVTLCHNGNTITVAQSAVSAHMAHGDTEGVCGAGEGVPSNVLSVVMMRCEAQLGGGVLVVSASSSVPIEYIGEDGDSILDARDDCAEAMAFLAQQGFGLRTVNSGSAEDDNGQLHLYVDYLLFGRVEAP